MLEAVKGGFCLSEVPEVMRSVLLRILQALEGVLSLFGGGGSGGVECWSFLDLLEVLCVLGVVEGGLSSLLVLLVL
jgi:hypothetical protein